MRRACKLTLKFATESKRRKVRSLIDAYRGGVNFFCRSLWKDKGKLDADTLARLKKTRLSERYKSQSLKQAIETVVFTKLSAKALGRPASRPIFEGSPILDSKFVSIEKGEKSFDVVVRLSTLKKGDRICIPTRGTKMLRKWLSKPGAKIVPGCCLTASYVIVWVDVPDVPMRTKGSTAGIDLGINKLIATSDGLFYGEGIKRILEKISRKMPGGKAAARARDERKNYINRTINSLPWDSWQAVGVEDLRGIKQGKKKNRGKSFRKAVSPWAQRQVLDRIRTKAEENRVLVVAVPARYTSRTCPDCGTESSESRRGENFECVSCGRRGDADHIGALNVLARTLMAVGSVESPMQKRTVRA